MDKEEIVKSLLDRGQLVTPGALEEIFAAGRLPDIKERFVIDITDVDSDDVRVVKNLPARPKEVDTDMFLKFYTSKYNKMREIFVSRYQKNFISLNKLDASRTDVALFGIVKEVKGKTVELEDMTSSVSVIFEDVPLDNIQRDDAILVEGVSGGKVVYGKKALFADVPIRQAATGKGRACFVADLRLNEAPLSDAEKFFVWFQKENIKYLFISGVVGDVKALEGLVEKYCTGKKIFLSAAGDEKEYPHLPVKVEKSNVTSISNPAMVEVNGIKVLLVHKFDTAMLKKRYLGKSRAILPEDYLVLDEVPDIVLHAAQKPFTSNYKSISIVSSGSLLEEFKPIVIDLETREVREVSPA